MIIKIPYQFTQEEFEDKINEVGIENITELDLNFCENISNIFYFPNLKILNCSYASISSIALMEKLEELWCHHCPNLVEIPNFPNLKELHYWNCYNILEIPNFSDLKELSCEYTNTTSIPLMKNLEILDCRKCPNFYKIPHLPNLKILKCNNNLKIKFYFKNLEIIYEDILFTYLGHRYKNTHHHFQGRLYQNTYRTYELLIF